MHKLLVVLAVALLASSSASAQSRKTRPGAAMTGTQDLSPDLAALREAQRTWPGRPLCDEGGYRIRPCGLGSGGAGGGM